MGKPKLFGKPLPYHPEHIYLLKEDDFRHRYKLLDVFDWIDRGRVLSETYAPGLPPKRGYQRFLNDIKQTAPRCAWLIVHTPMRDHVTNIGVSYAINLNAPLTAIIEAFDKTHNADRSFNFHYTAMTDADYQAAKQNGGVNSLHAEIETGLKAFNPPAKLLTALEIPTHDIYKTRLLAEFLSGEIFSRDKKMLLEHYHEVQQAGTDCLSNPGMALELREKAGDLLKDLARAFIDQKLQAVKQPNKQP